MVAQSTPTYPGSSQYNPGNNDKNESETTKPATFDDEIKNQEL